MAATRDDVARLAGVSPATVSYVINDGPRPVSEEARLKVLSAVEQLDYTPSTIARSLKTQKTNAVGLVVSDIQNPFLAHIAKSAEDNLLGRGYSLTVCSSSESAEREQVWLNQFRQRRVDGMILIPTGSNRSVLQAMLDAGQQLVLIDRRVEGIQADCVAIDNEQGAYDATRHLIQAGHTRIGLLNLPGAYLPGSGRFAGYRDALREAGLAVAPELVRECRFLGHDSERLVAELLDARPAPTAIFAASNRLAEGLLRQVKARRLQVPDDLAVCVFDDVSYYAFFEPSITAVAVDGCALARQAVQFLIERVQGQYAGEPRTARVPCRLHIRESTGIRLGEGVRTRGAD